MSTDAPQRAAPGRLEVVRAFVNTRDIDEATDALGEPAALVPWLTTHGLAASPSPLDVDARGLQRAVALREALRALLVAHAGGPDPAGAVAVVNAVAASAGVVARLGPTRHLAIRPTADGLEGALGELVAIVFDAISDELWLRLKACPADGCRWAFFDSSRNASARWCSMAGCGNREKARALRRRRAPHASR